MQDILKDIVAHTHALGFLTLLRVTSEDETTIESRTDDRSVILTATTHNKIAEFDGVFGMGNLDKLALHLKNPEYQDGASIDVIKEDRNGENVPTTIHFENKSGDYENDYRFMNKNVLDERMKKVTFKGAQWDVEIEPSIAAISRMKLQSAVHNDEPVFNARCENDQLLISFGDAGSHAGKFVFAEGVGTGLKHTWSWPVAQTIAILSFDGDTTMKLTDQGAMMLSVDSGLAKYDYILPAQAK